MYFEWLQFFFSFHSFQFRILRKATRHCTVRMHCIAVEIEQHNAFKTQYSRLLIACYAQFKMQNITFSLNQNEGKKQQQQQKKIKRNATVNTYSNRASSWILNVIGRTRYAFAKHVFIGHSMRFHCICREFFFSFVLFSLLMCCFSN